MVYYQQSKRIDVFSCALILLTVVLIFIENEIFDNNEFSSSNINTLLRCVIIILSAIITVLICLSYLLSLRMINLELSDDCKLTFLNLRTFPKFLFHILVNLICCPPMLDTTFKIRQLNITVLYTLDSIILVISLFRLCYLFVLIQHYSKWMSHKSLRLYKAFGIKADYKFALKAYLKYNSYSFIFVTMLLSTVVFGVVLRAFEKNTGSERNNFNYIWNAFWVIIVTMTTVGYGDMYPITHLGRVTVIIACIVGAIVLTFFVSALNSALELDPKEKEASQMFEKNKNIKCYLSNDADALIANFIRLSVLRKIRMANQSEIKIRSPSYYSQLCIKAANCFIEILKKAPKFKIKRLIVHKDNENIENLLEELLYSVKSCNELVSHKMSQFREVKTLSKYVKSERLTTICDTTALMKESEKTIELIHSFD